MHLFNQKKKKKQQQQQKKKPLKIRPRLVMVFKQQKLLFKHQHQNIYFHTLFIYVFP